MVKFKRFGYCAINLVLCLNRSTSEYLRAFQLHCYSYGIPTHCLSDMGSQLISGSNMKSYINDYETSFYFEPNNIKPLTFQ